MIDAFSTSFSSANANSSVGDFCFNSLSFISRIGGPLLGLPVPGDRKVADWMDDGADDSRRNAVVSGPRDENWIGRSSAASRTRVDDHGRRFIVGFAEFFN